MIGAKKGVISAGIFGNAVEWYDFTAYAFFAPILATLFFPATDPFNSLLMAFGVFAAGFLVRPLGGIFFGYVGDHFGRKKALILSMIVMSLPTLLMGLLPSYAAIGIAAPLLLTFLRVIQGLAVSGELTSATSFLVEHAKDTRRGLAGSLAMGSAFIGIVASSAVVTAVTELTTSTQLTSWGWRLPFIFGGLLGLVGLFIRLRSHETEQYQQAKQNERIAPRPSVFKHLAILQYKPIFIAILLTCIMAVGNYLLIGYFNAFLIKTEGLPIKNVMLINFISLFLLTCLMPIMGIISDKIGRKPVLGSGIIGFIIFTLPIFWLLQQHSILYAFIGQLLFILALAPIAGLIPTTVAELFNVQDRNSGISIGYNTSLALFGGTAPLVAIALTKMTHNNFSPAWYLMACAVLSLIALLTIKESYQKQLS